MISIRGGYATTWHTCQLSFKELFESTGDSVHNIKCKLDGPSSGDHLILEDILVRHNKITFATVGHEKGKIIFGGAKYLDRVGEKELLRRTRRKVFEE